MGKPHRGTVVFLLFACTCRAAAGQRVFHVSPEGDDAQVGTQAAPLATPAGARNAIRALKQKQGLPAGGVKVLIRGGRYFLTEPLTLTAEDSGTRAAPIVYAAAAGEKVVLSGGRPVRGWRTPGKDSAIAVLPEAFARKWHFRQLFADGKRLTRARTPNEGYFLTAGPLSAFSERAKRHWDGYRGIRGLRGEHPEAYCGFAFRAEEFENLINWQDVEVITYHSWECSWQTIRRIDHEKKEVHFNTPCRYPIGFFSNQLRYRVENTPKALDAPGEWYLDRGMGMLIYRCRRGEEPSRMDFVAPVLEKLLVLSGRRDRPVQYVTFRGLSFRHAKYPMGIYDVAPDWPKPVLKVRPNWPRDFRPGYTDAQAAPLCGQVIELKDAAHCAIENCEITLIGSSGVKIFERSHHNRVTGCHIHDVGGGGVLVGINVRSVDREKLPPSEAPSHNVIENNRIERISLVHPSAVGVWIAQSHHNRVSNNVIADVGYAGIHLGWTWGRYPNYTDNNLIERNHIHHVMRDLADAAGIYSLGPQQGTVYRENYIHDIRRAEGAVGAPVDGLFFDQGSQHIHVERNVIRRCGHAVYRFNQCKKQDMTWKDNDFDHTDSPVRLKEVASKAGPRRRRSTDPDSSEPLGSDSE
ncbi:MAG: right-handed parallel beta-helix repeat-containing protein [Phycisphaerae bacterium]